MKVELNGFKYLIGIFGQNPELPNKYTPTACFWAKPISISIRISYLFHSTFFIKYFLTFLFHSCIL